MSNIVHLSRDEWTHKKTEDVTQEDLGYMDYIREKNLNFLEKWGEKASMLLCWICNVLPELKVEYPRSILNVVCPTFLDIGKYNCGVYTSRKLVQMNNKHRVDLELDLVVSIKTATRNMRKFMALELGECCNVSAAMVRSSYNYRIQYNTEKIAEWLCERRINWLLE